MCSCAGLCCVTLGCVVLRWAGLCYAGLGCATLGWVVLRWAGLCYDGLCGARLGYVVLAMLSSVSYAQL